MKFIFSPYETLDDPVTQHILELMCYYLYGLRKDSIRPRNR